MASKDRVPFDPPYSADDLPRLDLLHAHVGLGPEWLASDRREEIRTAPVADPDDTKDGQR